MSDTGFVYIAGLNATPDARWEADASDPRRPRRHHFYAEGAAESACANYRRPVAAVADDEPADCCVRCIEALAAAEGSAR